LDACHGYAVAGFSRFLTTYSPQPIISLGPTQNTQAA
jgi:hypothetical protein